MMSHFSRHECSLLILDRCKATTYYLLPTTYHLLPRVLPTAYCLPPTAYLLLLTACPD
jgi:hypothetical protein